MDVGPPADTARPMSETPVIPPPAPEGESPRQSTPFLVLQFFIFPLAIVAVCVTVFVIFGLIASEGRGARDYLDEVRTGSANRRWQAAFELSKVLQAGKDPALKDPKFVDEVVRTFRETSPEDPRVRRYLALTLGRLGDRRAVPALLEAVPDTGAQGGHPDADTQVYAVWALGAIGDAQAVPALVALTRSEDPGLRKTAAHALGGFTSAEATAALVPLLQDPVNDVRWNGALALARHGDAAAAPVLAEMLDRERMAVAGMSEEQREEVMVQAARAAGVIADPGLQDALRRLRDSDPSMKVRDAARGALEARAGRAPHP
jgi:HEAT repeat protein